MQAQLTTAIFFIYALGVLVATGLITLFAIKLRHVLAERQARRCLEKYADYFYYLQAHGEEEERLRVPHSKLTDKEKRIIQRRLLELIERVTGVHRHNLIRLCEDLGLVERDRERLMSWWKWTKVDAAYNLGLMRASEAVPGMLQLLQKSKFDSSVFIVARAIAKAATSDAHLREMAVSVLSYRKNCHQLIVDILEEARVDTALLFGKWLREEDPELVKIGLIGLSSHNVTHFEPTLYKLAQSPNKEIRIKAVKLMCQDLRYLNAEMIAKCLAHEDWEIRALTAKAIGDMGLSEHITKLKHAVGDSNWQVSRNSAYSLARLDVEGFLALCEILREEEAGSKIVMAYQVVREELDKGERQLDDLDAQIQYNQKLFHFRKWSQEEWPTAHALER